MPLWPLFLRREGERGICFLGWDFALRQSLGQEVEQLHLPSTPPLRRDPASETLLWGSAPLQRLISAGGKEDALALQHPSSPACSWCRGAELWLSIPTAFSSLCSASACSLPPAGRTRPSQKWGALRGNPDKPQIGKEFAHSWTVALRLSAVLP